jgi:protein subunit release factor A
MTPRNFIDGHEADIVPVMRVFRAGIAEANKESHAAASRASARSAKVDTGFASDRALTLDWRAIRAADRIPLSLIARCRRMSP